MHVGRRANPRDVNVFNREQVGPVRHRRGMRNKFVAEGLRTFVGRIRDGNDLHIVAFLQAGQMPALDDIAGANDADASFAVLVSHAFVTAELRLTTCCWSCSTPKIQLTCYASAAVYALFSGLCREFAASQDHASHAAASFIVAVWRRRRVALAVTSRRTCRELSVPTCASIASGFPSSRNSCASNSRPAD